MIVSNTESFSLPHISAMGIVFHDSNKDSGTIEIFGKNELEAVRVFASAGTHIPTELYSVFAMLETDNRMINGNRFLTKLTELCRKWPSLEKELIGILKSLCAYGKTVVSAATAIENKISAMPIMLRLQEIGSSGITVIALEQGDKAILLSLPKYLNKLRNEALENKSMANRIGQKLENYRLEIDNNLLPQALLIKNAVLNHPALEVRVKVDGRTYEINVPNGKFLEKRPVGGSIVESLRNAKNSQEAEKAIKEAEFFFTPIAEAIRCTCLEIGTIDSAIQNGALGIRALEVLWDGVSKNAEQAHEELKKVEDSTKLMVFKSRISAFAKSWSNIAEEADKLLKIV